MAIIDLPLEVKEYDSSLPSHFINVDEALVKSMDTFGCVNMDFICAQSGKEIDEVTSLLGDSIFQNPETWNENPLLGWEIKSEYLSGNIYEKLKLARQGNYLYPNRFKRNVEALNEVLPCYISSNQVYFSLGASWIPASIVEDFIFHLAKSGYSIYKVTHDINTGSWTIQNKKYKFSNTKLNLKYGTNRMSACEIIEHILNQTPIQVKDYVRRKGKRVLEINQGETLAANSRVSVINEEFRNWVFSYPNRQAKLIDLYRKKYGSYVVKKYDGSFLSFPKMNKNIQLRKYQRDAIARIILSPNTLLAHDVGLGKTYEMIAAGEELLRMGKSSKNLYVVPNSIITDWKNAYSTLYPESNIIVVYPKDFTPSKRIDTLINIKESSNVSIIMPYSVFDMIEVSKNYRLQGVVDEMSINNQSYMNARSSTRKVKSRKVTLEKKLKKLSEEAETQLIPFEDLGVSRLFVDEAHNYKNLNISTLISESGSSSKKCESMLEKVMSVQKVNNGGGVVFATATPITNSISELFIMQKYLQNGTLNILGLNSFEAWIANYAEKSAHFELSASTTEYKMKYRYSKFHNLQELSSILSYIIDFHHNDLSILPSFGDYSDELLPRSYLLDNYLHKISKRADKIKKREVDPKEDNFLKITTDGRKAALDIRLVEPSLKQVVLTSSKLELCSSRIMQIYQKYNDSLATQLVFCDISVASDKEWNVYTALKENLIQKGIPEAEIAFIQDYDSPASKEKLFDSFNKGLIRVLIGSTFKLGTGVNVQVKLKAIHHLDIPWRPSDMVQREGRMLRFGNTNNEVFIYRYITEGSFDAYSWQLLERKQRFISGLLSSTSNERDSDDVDSSVLSYAEIKALAIGNPMIKERCEIQNEIYRLRILDRKTIEARELLEMKIKNAHQTIADNTLLINNSKLDETQYKKYNIKFITSDKKAIADNLYNALIAAHNNNNEQHIGSYKGFEIYKSSASKIDKKVIFIKGNNRYYLDVKDSSLGLLARIDNFLNDFNSFREPLYKKNASLNEMISTADFNSFKLNTELIANLNDKLNRIDNKLKEDK